MSGRFHAPGHSAQQATAQQATAQQGDRAAFCTDCGAPLGDRLRFCTACGAPRYTVSRAPAQAEQAVAPPIARSVRWQPSPARVQLLIGIAAAVMLLCCFPFWRGRWGAGNYTLMALRVALFALLNGACGWLLMQRDARSRIVGGAGLALAVVLSTFGSSVALTGLLRISQIFRSPTLFAQLGRELAFALILAGAALGLGLADKQGKLRPAARALLFAGVYLLLGLFGRLGALRALAGGGMPSAYAAQVFGSLALGAAAVFAAALYCAMLQNLRGPAVVLSTGFKVWGWLVVAVTMLAVVAMPFLDRKDAMSMLVSLAAVAGMALLLSGRRIGYPINLLAVGLTIYVNLYNGIFYPQLSSRSALLVQGLVGMLNPLITWLLLRRGWGPQEGDVPEHIKI